jgi:hypothetical protein
MYVCFMRLSIVWGVIFVASAAGIQLGKFPEAIQYFVLYIFYKWHFIFMS